MDQHRFDALVSLLAVAGAGQQAVAACKQNRKPCTDRNQCCSGVCRGPRGNKKCRAAPGQGTCTTDIDTCEIGGQVAFCGDPSQGCSCFIRPNGAAFCADTTTFDCLPCAQCPTGTTCVRARNGLCVACPVGTGATEVICVKPCPA